MSKNLKTKVEFWDNRAKISKNDRELVYESQLFGNNQKIAEDIIKIFSRPGMRVLDIGCGFGRFYPEFEKAGVVYVGVDSSKEMLKIACQRFSQGTFILDDWNKKDPTLGQFDLVFECICLSSSDPNNEDASIKKFENILMKWVSPGGKLIMIEPSEIKIISNQGNLFEL